MRAATLVSPGLVEVREFPDPVATAPGELVVRTHRASICGSDVHAVFDGFHVEAQLGSPGYPGHEGVGIVVESRSERFAVGDPVLTAPAGLAGSCFAELQLIGEDFVVPLPAGGDLDRLLLAQQYGTVLYAWRSFWPGDRPPGAGSTAAIIGAGSAGLFFAQAAQRAGFEHVLISEKDPARIAVARELGAQVIEVPRQSFVAAVMEVTHGAGAELVIEAAGFDATRSEAIHACARRGTVGLFGYAEVPGDAPVPMREAFRKALRLQWMVGAQSEPGLVAFRDAVADIHAGRIAVEHCLGTVVPLEEIASALQRAREGGRGAVKIAIAF